MKNVNIDKALAPWLIRIGVKPFTPKPQTSPIINYLLECYSHSICRAMLNEQTTRDVSIEDVFRHCGIPNVLLAHLHSQRLIEALHLHGQRLHACEQQYSFLSQTSFTSVIDYHKDNEPKGCINDIVLSTIEAC